MAKYTVRLLFTIEVDVHCEVEAENEEDIQSEIDGNDVLQELGIRMAHTAGGEVGTTDRSRTVSGHVADLRLVEPFDARVDRNPDYEFEIVSIDPHQDTDDDT